jgi:hypothetical protein
MTRQASASGWPWRQPGADALRQHEVAPAAFKEVSMSAYERQLIAKYHHADLLNEAHQAHLAKIARSAGRPRTERIGMAPLSGPLQSFLTAARGWMSSRGAAAKRAAASQPSVTGHVMRRSTQHP